MAAASSLADPEFWLPSEFLTDDDINCIGKENFNRNASDDLSFPTDFPYEFASSCTESESDDDDLSLLARQISRATLREPPPKISFSPPNLQGKRFFSGSPQSTLSTVGGWSVSSNGSPNGPSQVPSPPATPFLPADDAWDLIYAAAGQVARMKMNMSLVNVEGTRKNGGGFLAPNRCLGSLKYSHDCLSHRANNHFQQLRPETVMKQNGDSGSLWERREVAEMYSLSHSHSHSHSHFHNPQICQNRGVRAGTVAAGGGLRPLGLSQSAWPPLQVHKQYGPNHHSPAAKLGFHAGSDGGGGGAGGGNAAVKRGCAGTGVFLPRRYANPSESRKKPTEGSSSTWVPSRVVQGVKKNNDSQAQSQLNNFNGGIAPNYDLVMARRRALLAAAQQRTTNIMRAEVGMNLNVNLNLNMNLNLNQHHHPDLLLPQEWTY